MKIEHKSVAKIVDTANSPAIKSLDDVCEGVLEELRALPNGEIIVSYKDSKKDTFMWALLLVVMKERDLI